MSKEEINSLRINKEETVMPDKILFFLGKIGKHGAQGADDGRPVAERGPEARGGDPARAAEGV